MNQLNRCKTGFFHMERDVNRTSIERIYVIIIKYYLHYYQFSTLSISQTFKVAKSKAMKGIN